MSNRTPNQNLVPKQADEAEKGASRRQGDKRTSQARTGRTGQTEAATAREATEDGTATPFVQPTPAPPRSHEDGAGQDQQ